MSTCFHDPDGRDILRMRSRTYAALAPPRRVGASSKPHRPRHSSSSSCLCRFLSLSLRLFTRLPTSLLSVQVRHSTYCGSRRDWRQMKGDGKPKKDWCASLFQSPPLQFQASLLHTCCACWSACGRLRETALRRRPRHPWRAASAITSPWNLATRTKALLR